MHGLPVGWGSSIMLPSWRPWKASPESPSGRHTDLIPCTATPRLEQTFPQPMNSIGDWAACRVRSGYLKNQVKAKIKHRRGWVTEKEPPTPEPHEGGTLRKKDARSRWEVWSPTLCLWKGKYDLYPFPKVSLRRNPHIDKKSSPGSLHISHFLQFQSC